MEYSAEEITFVVFCSEHLSCEPKQGVQCPLYESCYEVCGEKDEDSRLCRQIAIKMQNEEELTCEEKDVINFFLDDDQWQYKKKTRCYSMRDGVRCPNRTLCDERGADQETPCKQLFDRLGLDSTEELDMAEKEVEKIILNNLGSIDWGMQEKLLFYNCQPSISSIGHPDILLQGPESKTLYVVELKAGRATRENVGQLASYVGWYKKNTPAGFNGVKGVLLARDFTEGVKYALELSPDLEARLFELHIEIKKVGH